MTQDQVDQFILANQKYLPTEKIAFIKDKLLKTDESKFTLVSSIEFKDPTVLLLVSIFVGGIGVDRFMLGEVGMGVLKLLTLGVCGVLWIIDLCTVQKKTREFNYNNLMLVL